MPADLIWPNLVLLGVEQVEIEPGVTAMTPLNFLHYPFSHSLLALLLWGALFAILYRVLVRSDMRSAAVIAVPFETLLFVAGVWLYTRQTLVYPAE